MPTFALIAEGITDQAVIESVIREYYRARLGDEVDVNNLQPVRDATDEARVSGQGGWERVLEYCSFRDRISEALSLNDYLVIQIDTDCGEQKNFGVPLTSGGVERSVNDIIVDVKGVIAQRLDNAFYELHRDRFIFAIAVHSLECWLLPLHAHTNSAKSRTLSCEHHLVLALTKKDISYGKNYRSYKMISHGFNRIENIVMASKHSKSFAIFLESLPDLSDASV
jgi:hypothetical protein